MSSLPKNPLQGCGGNRHSDRYHYARFLSRFTKNRTAEHADAVTQLAMELFGGIGFLDDFGIARLHRESLVTLIWEGASNIQALDYAGSDIRPGH